MRFFALSFSFLAIMFVQGCGFTPVHGPASRNNDQSTSYVADQFAAIQIANIPEKTGLDLRNELIDRFYRDGRPQSPRYTLIIDPILEVNAGLGISKDASVTRSQLRQRTALKLQDNQTKKTIFKRDVKSVTSYNVLDSHFTTLISEKEARKNGLNELADQITLHLDLFFTREQTAVSNDL